MEDVVFLEFELSLFVRSRQMCLLLALRWQIFVPFGILHSSSLSASHVLSITLITRLEYATHLKVPTLCKNLKQV